MTVFVDLILDNGQHIEIECPNKFQDDMFETLRHAMKKGDSWSPMRFEGCNATYLGERINSVNMARVVGLG